MLALQLINSKAYIYSTKYSRIIEYVVFFIFEMTLSMIDVYLMIIEYWQTTLS